MPDLHTGIVYGCANECTPSLPFKYHLLARHKFLLILARYVQKLNGDFQLYPNTASSCNRWSSLAFLSCAFLRYSVPRSQFTGELSFWEYPRVSGFVQRRQAGHTYFMKEVHIANCV